MGESLQLPFPMLRVQYQLLGGHRRMAAVVFGSAGVLALAILVTQRLAHPQPFAVVADWVLGFLTGLQVIVAVLAGCNAIYRAMLRDYQNNMVESHRLTPMSSFAVTLGYFFGSTLQTTALLVVIAIAGGAVSHFAGFSVGGWIRGNLLLINGALALWAASVFVGMRPEKPMSPAPILLGIAILAGPNLAIPALGLLTSVYSVGLGIWMMNGTTPVPPVAVAIVASVSVVFTGFWLSAAAVKYRRPDLPALNGVRSLVLLVLVVLIGTAGIVAFDDITGSSRRLSDFRKWGSRIQWIATMAGAMMLSAVAVAGAVKCRVLDSRGTSLRNWADRVSPYSVAVLAAVLICAVMAGAGRTIWPGLLTEGFAETTREALDTNASAWLWTGAACLLATLSLCGVFKIGYCMFSSPTYFVLIFFILAWALLPAVDAVRTEYMHDYKEAAEFSWLMGCSPLGMIGAIWFPIPIRLWPGLLVQFALLVLVTLFARRAERRGHSSSMAEAAGR